MSDSAQGGTDWVVEPPATASLPIVDEEGRFPVVRIWCVGRNYEAHAREMEPDSVTPPEIAAPFFFLKPASALAPGGGPVPFPDDTDLLHHEVELVVALGARGRKVPETEAESLVYGFGVGLDLTRRDRQSEAKALGRPWSLAKGFDRSAPCSALMPERRVGALKRGRITAVVNGERRQDADVSEMIWSVPRMIALLSRQVEILPGDLLFTGTPAGVGPLEVGDEVAAEIAGVGRLDVNIVRREGG